MLFGVLRLLRIRFWLRAGSLLVWLCHSKHQTRAGKRSGERVFSGEANPILPCLHIIRVKIISGNWIDRLVGYPRLAASNQTPCILKFNVSETTICTVILKKREIGVKDLSKKSSWNSLSTRRCGASPERVRTFDHSINSRTLYR